MNFDNLDILILGYSKSGKGAVNLLQKLNANVYVYDDNITDINSDIEVVDKPNRDYDMAVVSPAFSEKHKIMQELKAKNIKVISEIELSYLICQSSIIAVTGTNGKSTVTKLSENLLKKAGIDAVACGNFGVAFSSIVADCDRSLVPIVEVSSFQLENIECFSPDIAIITNISKDHLDRYSSFDEYIATKKKIIQNQLPKDYLILNYDDAIVRDFAKESRAKVFYFSGKNRVNGAYLVDDNICVFRNNQEIRLCKTSDIYLDYPFEVMNVLAVVTLGSILNIPLSVIVETIREYKPLPHRLQLVGEYFGKKYYDNSKATNVASTLASVNAIKEDSILILGGSNKNEDFIELFNNLPENVKYIAICGENAKSILKIASLYNTKAKIYNSLQDIITETKDYTDIKAVILAPSSASFDSYNNFEERGQKFCEIVKSLV